MKCAMWNVKCVMRKSGVSLVTVLLFMLVATIAATATYKWITSEGRSSASRMMQREAYQSAVAGIESARSWMTYHANETGALIKQYKDGHNAPIKLNDQLAQFVRAGQSFDVWLVGVNTETPTYKLKIMSTGKARNGGASHSELAILNVNGLYQVTIPRENVTVPAIFKYAYFGGSISYDGTTEASAMVVNGNWDGNPPKTVTGDFVVTGNALLDGNNIEVAGTACIGGLLSKSGGNDVTFYSQNLYAAGNVEHINPYISQNAYFGGNVSMGQNCNAGASDPFKSAEGFWVNGNMTVSGTLNFDNCAKNKPITVVGNTCVIKEVENGTVVKNGKIVIPATISTGGTFGTGARLKGHAWMDSDFPIWREGSSDNYDNYDKLIIGENSGSNIYIKNAHAWSDYSDLGKFTEEGKKACTNTFRIRTQSAPGATDDYNWPGNNPPAFNETPNAFMVTACGILGAKTADKRSWSFKERSGNDYFVSFTDAWSIWDGKEHTVYTPKAEKPNLYYIYNAPDDYLTFKKDETLNSWRTFTDIGDWNADHEGYDYAIPIHPTGSNGYETTYNFDKYFQQKPVIGAYKFGTSRYYNPTEDEHTFYRYESNVATGSPYCYNGGDDYRPTCAVKPWFKIDGTFKTWVSPKPADLICGESTTKGHCDSVWTSTPNAGCDMYKKDGTYQGKANYKVNDQLTTGYSVFSTYAGRSTCTWSTHEELATCYNQAKEHDKDITKEDDKILYNGYMVLNLPPEHFKNTTTAFDGKYIIIINPGTYAEMMKFPPTKDNDDYVMVYITGDFDGQNNYIEALSPDVRYNYFIFSEGNIGKVMSFKNLHGTIYARSSTCKRVKNIHSSKLTLNEDLLTDMNANGLLCKANVSSCGGPASAIAASASSGEATVTTTYTSDSYYIGVAPQLSVTLESQYENNETIGGTANAASVAGSFIVLPRVVRLTKDAVGELDDYYKVVVLNSESSANVTGISCSPTPGVPTSGSLTASGQLVENLYTCNVTATVDGASQTVPFFVVVHGEGATAPDVSFVDPLVEVSIGNESEVELEWQETTGAAGIECKVTIEVGGNEGGEWSVDKYPGAPVDGSGPYEVTFNTSSTSPMKILTVTNNSSSDGSISLIMTKTEGCRPGVTPAEVLFNSNSMTVRREGLAAYCGPSGPGYETAACASGGDYYEKMSWPDCFGTDDEELWVRAVGQNCVPSGDMNDEWSCGITSGVSLEAVQNNIPGCVVILPENGSATSASSFSNGDEVTLYADVKAVKQVFHAGFASDPGDNSQITITVTGPGAGTKTCNYNQFNASSSSSSTESAPCDMDVFRNSVVSLSVSPTDNFNYWECVSGADCTPGETNRTFPPIVVTGANTVYAHFNETDRHCFFDQFKDGSGNYRYNRSEVECSEGETGYCIDDCGSHCQSATTGSSNIKWKLVSGDFDDLDYSSGDGRISLKSGLTYGKKDAEKANVKAVIMSTAVAGRYGTLKAQFQVPREGISQNDIAKATVKNSGLILRSSPDNTSALRLNVYSGSDGELKARLCVIQSTGETCSDPKSLTASVSPTDISMVKARLYSDAGIDKLEVSVLPNSWTTTSYSTTFTLTNSNLSGVETTKSYEYVGYSLADPNFKLYGIGWESESYGSQCWDTPPTINCSFKAAYAGGIVPRYNPLKNDPPVKPWTGLSDWFGSNDCSIEYHYNGTDACGNSSDGTYASCGTTGYEFTATGAHGYKVTNAETGAVEEKNTAKVSVTGCSVHGEEAQWTNDITAHCGKFWVGDFSQCNRNYTFSLTTAGYFSLAADAKANLRDAKLVVDLTNTDNKEFEVYLISKNDSSGYSYGVSQQIFSMPYTSNGTGVIQIPVSDLSNSEGFDPENVIGGYVKTFGEAITINSVKSTCEHVINLSSECPATYNRSTGKWSIAATVNNGATTNYSLEVSQATTDAHQISATAPSCSYTTSSTGNCSSPTHTFAWEDNPHAIASDDDKLSYHFTVTLTPADNEIEPVSCSSTGEVAPVGRECSITSGTDPVVVGMGLPEFNYSISCPDQQCTYKILVDGEKIYEPDDYSGGYTGTAPVDGANTDSDPLSASSEAHTITLVSTNNARAFTNCELSFYVVASSSSAAESSSSEEESSSSVASSNSGIPVTPNCEIQDNSNNKITSSVYPSKQVKFKITNNNTSGDGLQMALSGKASKWENNVLIDYDMSLTPTWNNNGTLEQGYSVPKTPGTYSYVLTYNGAQVCNETIVVIEAGSDLRPTCAIKNSSNTIITSAWPGSSVKFVTTTNNTSGEGFNTSLHGKASKWENNVQIDYDMSFTPGWNNGSSLTQDFNVPKTIGSYTYVLKTLSGATQLCTTNFSVVAKGTGVTATCKIKKDGNEISKVAGGTTGISFDVSGVQNCPENYDGKLNFNNTSQTINCGNSNCWNNTFTAPAAQDNDVDYIFTLTTADGVYEICRDTLTVRGNVIPSGNNDYAICLDKADNGGWPQITSGISTAGAYMVLHDCQGTNSYSYFYSCSNGASISWDGSDLTCNGNEQQASTSSMPSSGTILTITSGTLTKIGCEYGSGSSPCSGTGIMTGSGTEDSPYEDGNIGNFEHKKQYMANTWYSVTTSAGQFVVQNHTNAAQSFTYKDCSGTEHTATLSKGQEGDSHCGSGWWNCFESVSADCTIKFKFGNAGQFDLKAW